MFKFFILALGIHFICFNSMASENCNKHDSELKKAICYERNGEYKKAKNTLKNFKKNDKFYYWYRIKKEAQIIAQQRNKERRRTLPEKAVAEMWSQVQKNIGGIQQLFGSRNFIIVDNKSFKFNIESFSIIFTFFLFSNSVFIVRT